MLLGNGCRGWLCWKMNKKNGVSKGLIPRMFSAGMSGLIQGFMRCSVVVGWMILFIPRYIPENAHILIYIFTWLLYVIVPYLLWKVFDKLDKIIETVFNAEEK